MDKAVTGGAAEPRRYQVRPLPVPVFRRLPWTKKAPNGKNDIAYYDTEKRNCFVWGHSIDKDFKRERENLYADTIEEALDSMKRLGVDITVDD